MTPEEIRDLSSEELSTKSAELRSELFNVRVKHATGQLENTAMIGKLRKDIARVETILRAKLGADQ
ncbi:MAG: 50S ribosomal protein L29 [Myxococcota bacterium]|nr:50S ribosomal protein L29 [Myxococcota bacterium]